MNRLLAAVLICGWGAASAFAVSSDDAQRWLTLTRPDSLVGWHAADAKPEGWQMAGGVLRGDQQSAPLRCEWAFGNFEVELHWSAQPGAAWQIGCAPIGDEGKPEEAATLTLSDGEACGRLTYNGRTLAGEQAPELRDADQHHALLQRSGKTFTVTIDGRQLYAAELPLTAKIQLTLDLTGGAGELRNLRVREPRGESLLQDGLAGWWTPGNIEAWSIEDGVLSKFGRGGNYLRSEQEYSDFTLSLEYKLVEGNNSGIGIRTPRDGWPSRDGMELQIYDRPGLEPNSNMSLYGHVKPLARADRPDQWNRTVVRAQGRLISAWVDGQLVQHADTSQHQGLKNKPLSGWIGFQDHGGQIAFRDVYLLDLSASEQP
ncbi:MAG: DUF1080 domain-containing protein [Pirellulales bacterium]